MKALTITIESVLTDQEGALSFAGPRIQTVWSWGGGYA
jgi:hypothetical protein